MANDVLLNTTTDLNGKTLVTAEGDRSITGLLTYSRGASAPFAVGSGAASVANLDADKVDGQHAPTGTIVGTTDTQTLTNKTLTTPAISQVAFPSTQVPSSDPNTLDDYEEGTWTPTIGGTGGQSSQTYTTQVGSYVKIGRLVFAQFNITLSAKGTITTTAQIQGLPFTVENVAGTVHGQGLGFWATMTSSFVYISAIPLLNTTTANLFGATAAAATMTALVQADFSNTSTLTGCLMYRASA